MREWIRAWRGVWRGRVRGEKAEVDMTFWGWESSSKYRGLEEFWSWLRS